MCKMCIERSNQQAIEMRDSSFARLMRDVSGKVFHNEPPGKGSLI